MKSAHVRDEHVLVAIAAAPFRGTQRAYRHLSSVAGFGLVASLMSAYCAALSVEATYVAIPQAIQRTRLTEDAKRELRFVPKPYVADGAKLSRLSPLPNLARMAPKPLQFILGSPGNQRTVWDRPGSLAVAILIALVIQRYEAMVLRRRSHQETLDAFHEANSIMQVEADPRAIALAQLRASQHNAQGTGDTIGTFLGVCGVYGLEIAAFLGSFAGGGNALVNVVYGFLTICGFEVFDRMSDDSTEDESNV